MRDRSKEYARSRKSIFKLVEGLRSENEDVDKDPNIIY
jgi:hypothetical protein